MANFESEKFEGVVHGNRRSGLHKPLAHLLQGSGVTRGLVHLFSFFFRLPLGPSPRSASYLNCLMNLSLYLKASILWDFINGLHEEEGYSVCLATKQTKLCQLSSRHLIKGKKNSKIRQHFRRLLSYSVRLQNQPSLFCGPLGWRHIELAYRIIQGDRYHLCLDLAGPQQQDLAF